MDSVTYMQSGTKKRVIVSVTNDLSTDQRADRMCRTLVKIGFDVELVGRRMKESAPLSERPYRTRRMRLLFSKGPLFYAEYNKRLLLLLLFSRARLLVSNDLDTLAANFMASRLIGIPIIHDNHEYFRGVPELNGRRFTTRIWKAIEDFIFPKLKTILAVNDSIAKLYAEEYGLPVSVIRNVPIRNRVVIPRSKQELGIHETASVILYQGAVNVDRGLEEAILAMKHIRSEAVLLIIGTGDVIREIRKLVRENGLNGQVILIGAIPFEQLSGYTRLADIGLSIEKDVSVNYHFCLPNKFLDYIQAGIPVLIAPLPEMKAIVDRYAIGECITSHNPESLAADFDRMLSDPERMNGYRRNLAVAAADLCWENEEQELIRILKPYA